MSDDFYTEEVEYTDEEKTEVIEQIQSALWLHELENRTTKEKLKDWFARLSMKKYGEYCPDVTGNDLVEIAKEIGLEVKD